MSEYASLQLAEICDLAEPKTEDYIRVLRLLLVRQNQEDEKNAGAVFEIHKKFIRY